MMKPSKEGELPQSKRCSRMDFSTGGLIWLKGNGETPICYTDTCGDIYSDLLNKFTTNVATGAALASIVTNLRHHIFLNGD